MLASRPANVFTARWVNVMQLDQIKQALLESYRSYGGINHLDGVNLPSQESVNQLVPELSGSGKPLHVIGGALLAAELDAERAIREGTMLAARL